LDPTLTHFYYLPYAFVLGALHALEPGHAKTLTAAYLIGIKGTKTDALILGLAIAFTHSLVVVALAVGALWFGREALTEQATHWLQVGSGVAVMALGAWLLYRRWPRTRKPSPEAAQEHPHDHAHEHPHDHDHAHEDPDEHPDDVAHARQHAADMPEYATRGERPTLFQILAFGAVGGMIPCPAAVTVMLLALSIGQHALGLVAVLSFGVGLAVTLVCVGLAVVAGLSRLSRSGRLAWLSRHAPLVSAAMVLLSGVVALLFVH
jgi:nickel/cobalt exporter